jgi:tetratricopeptide (TPR) repeat protein
MSTESRADLRSLVRAVAREETIGDVSGSYEAGLARALDSFRWLHDSAMTPGERSVARADLFVVLQLAFERWGRPDLSEKMVDLGRVVVDETPTGSRRARQEANLANALRLRFEAAGDRGDLTEGVLHARKGLDETVEDGIQAQRLSNLGLLLRTRYEVLGRRADLDEAISRFREALELAGEPGQRRRRIQSNLGVALRLKGLVVDDEAVLREAASISMESLRDVPPFHLDRRGLVANAGLAAADLARVSRTKDDLKTAIALLTEAAGSMAPGEPDSASDLVNLAMVLRLEAAASPEDGGLLDQAVDAAAVAVNALVPGSPDAARAWAASGRAYWLRFVWRHEPADGERGTACRLEASEQASSPVRERALSGRMAGEWALRIAQPTTAVRGYSTAIELLPQVVWPGLDRGDREFELTEWGGLAEDAAAAALEIQAPDLAVALLEQGRSVLWGEQLNDEVIRRLETLDRGLVERLSDVRRRLGALTAFDRARHWSR